LIRPAETNPTLPDIFQRIQSTLWSTGWFGVVNFRSSEEWLDLHSFYLQSIQSAENMYLEKKKGLSGTRLTSSFPAICTIPNTSVRLTWWINVSRLYGCMGQDDL